MTVKTSAKKKPAAQVAVAKKAATLRAAADKKPQPIWLQQQALTTPTEIEIPEQQAETQAQGPPRFLLKDEVLKIARVSYVSVWTWMRAGTFPRSRIVGGKSMWLSTEIDQWFATRPVRKLKGDA
jgi:predicted DNA-binding transcriptional regulator AlpA